jgi:hypothetical protein
MVSAFVAFDRRFQGQDQKGKRYQSNTEEGVSLSSIAGARIDAHNAKRDHTARERGLLSLKLCWG